MDGWRVGDRVQVLYGPFMGRTGRVVQADSGGLIVLLRIFDRDTPVAMEADQLGPDSPRGESYG